MFDGKCFVLYTNSDGKIDNISRQEFDSWELAENYANGKGKLTTYIDNEVIEVFSGNMKKGK